MQNSIKSLVRKGNLPAEVMHDEIWYLNEVAQGIRDFEESVLEFDGQTSAERLVTLKRLEFMAEQAGVRRSDVSKAISRAGLPRKLRPFEQLRVPQAFRRHRTTQETKKSETSRLSALSHHYRFLMSLFSIADERRRRRCNAGCSHWWHHLRPRR